MLRYLGSIFATALAFSADCCAESGFLFGGQAAPAQQAGPQQLQPPPDFRLICAGTRVATARRTDGTLVHLGTSTFEYIFTVFLAARVVEDGGLRLNGVRITDDQLFYLSTVGTRVEETRSFQINRLTGAYNGLRETSFPGGLIHFYKEDGACKRAAERLF